MYMVAWFVSIKNCVLGGKNEHDKAELNVECFDPTEAKWIQRITSEDD